MSDMAECGESIYQHMVKMVRFDIIAFTIIINLLLVSLIKQLC